MSPTSKLNGLPFTPVFPAASVAVAVTEWFALLKGVPGVNVKLPFEPAVVCPIRKP